VTSPEWLAERGPAPLPDPDTLELIVGDAARRAAAIAAGESDPRDDDPLVDTIRLLAQAPTPERHQAISASTGLAEAEVRRLLLAFRHGGTVGVHAAVGATPLAEDRADEAARRVTTRHGSTAELDAAAGIVTDTVSGIQIRHGPDGRWYPFTRSGQRWWPAPGASPQADAAFAAALRARRAR
jgi:hypothetical protein